MPGVYSSVPPPRSQLAHLPGRVDIDAWTASTISHHMSLVDPHTPPTDQRLAAPVALPNTLFIPLYEPLSAKVTKPKGTAQTLLQKEKAKILKNKDGRREEKAKGKEGSKRRRRYENDRLIGVPNVEAPRPEDWEIGRTSPLRIVNWQIIDGVDLSSGQMMGDKREKDASKGPQKPIVPADLRERCKRKKAAKELLRGIEEEVRGFVADWQKEEEELARAAESDARSDVDSSDEEIVFVGRDLTARTRREKEEEMERLESAMAGMQIARPINAAGAFPRYLVHVLANYYGLRSWSVDETMHGRSEKERIAVVGLKGPKTATCSVPRKMLCEIV